MSAYEAPGQRIVIYDLERIVFDPCDLDAAAQDARTRQCPWLWAVELGPSAISVTNTDRCVAVA